MAEAGRSGARACERNDSCVLAAILIEGILGRGLDKYTVEHREACGIACTNAEYNEVLALAARVYDLDIVSAELKIDEIFGLRKEEILCGADGVELRRKLGTLLVSAILGIAVITVNGEIERLRFGNCGKKLAEPIFLYQLHYSLPPLSKSQGSPSPLLKFTSGDLPLSVSPA